MELDCKPPPYVAHLSDYTPTYKGKSPFFVARIVAKGPNFL